MTVPDPAALGRQTGRLPSAAAATAVLMGASACSFVDRQIMSLLVEPIRSDLGLSDTEISLLLGLAFVSCYALAGPPIGMLIDRHRRWRIVAAGIAFWSLMTAACAFAGGYWQIFFARMGVGVGEATLNPAAYSLIPDLVPREKLGISIATFGLGVYAGAGLALVIGGGVIGLLSTHPVILLPVVGAIRWWQAVFLIVAALGLPVAIIASRMPEPTRVGGTGKEAPTFRAVLAYFWSHRGVIGAVTLCWAFVLMAGYSVGAWFPAFLIRTFGWSAGQVGLWFGLVVVVAGAAGAVTGGLASDWAARRRGDGRVWTVTGFALAAAPAAIAYPLAGSAPLALALAGVFTVCQAAAAASVPTVLQQILPSRMRGLGSALVLAVTILLGAGLGPTVVALVTDLAFGDRLMIRYSLAVVVPVMALGAALMGAATLPSYARLHRLVEA